LQAVTQASTSGSPLDCRFPQRHAPVYVTARQCCLFTGLTCGTCRHRPRGPPGFRRIGIALVTSVGLCYQAGPHLWRAGRPAAQAPADADDQDEGFGHRALSTAPMTTPTNTPAGVSGVGSCGGTPGAPGAPGCAPLHTPASGRAPAGSAAEAGAQIAPDSRTAPMITGILRMSTSLIARQNRSGCLNSDPCPKSCPNRVNACGMHRDDTTRGIPASPRRRQLCATSARVFIPRASSGHLSTAATPRSLISTPSENRALPARSRHQPRLLLAPPAAGHGRGHVRTSSTTRTSVGTSADRSRAVSRTP
jgi:hypothetical protein